MKRCLSCSTNFRENWSCPKCSYCPQLIEGFLAFAPELAVDDLHNPTDFKTLADVEAGNFWFRARNRLIVWAIKHYFNSPTNMLEIGCGTGYVLSGVHDGFPHLTLSGSEASCAGLAFASRRVPRASLFQMDARNIPFHEEFDVIGAFDVLEHINEDEQVLREMYRAAKPGGGIVVTVPQHAFLWSHVDETAGHVRRYRARDLTGKISRAGFRVVRATSFVSLLLPLMLASRVGQRNSSGKQVAGSELRLSGLANTVLEKILDLERRLIQTGISLPAGGSLLVVATKP
jgi:SAM-dependent methyltransferase